MALFKKFKNNIGLDEEEKDEEEKDEEDEEEEEEEDEDEKPNKKNKKNKGEKAKNHHEEKSAKKKEEWPESIQDIYDKLRSGMPAKAKEGCFKLVIGDGRAKDSREIMLRD